MNIQHVSVRRSGRPKSAEKADAIRQAAIHLFMTEGMERTSMDAIAAAAGVSKQTVYSHFQSKNDLFRACVAGKIKMYGLDAQRLPDDAPLRDTLRHVGKQYLTLLSDKGVVCMFRLMASEASTHPKIVKTFHESGPLATAKFVSDLFSPHLPGAPDNAELAAQVASEFLSLVRGDYFLELILGTRPAIAPDDLEHHVEHCIGQIRKLYPLQGFAAADRE